MMNLEDNIDSANMYRVSATEIFVLQGDSLWKEKTNARFAMKFMDQLNVDSAINMILPFYQRVGYERDADALATIYLIDNKADLALPYIKKLKGEKDFEFQYYNDMAVYYSQKGEFEKSLAVYDSAFHIYQHQAMQILDAQIARVNGEYDKKLYDQKIELQHYRIGVVSLIFVIVAMVAIAFIIWLVRTLQSNKLQTTELKQAKEELEEKNEELVDTTKKQTQKLYAVSDICKNTYASIVLANHDMVKVISRSLYENLKEAYPQLSNMDFTYMFLDFIGLNAKDICRILNVQEGTYYCRRSAIKKKLGAELDQDIDELFNQFFLGKLVTE
jgi:large-conductance mechanosensitive channel